MPEACLGVACYNELAENMQAVSFVLFRCSFFAKMGASILKLMLRRLFKNGDVQCIALSVRYFSFL